MIKPAYKDHDPGYNDLGGGRSVNGVFPSYYDESIR